MTRTTLTILIVVIGSRLLGQSLTKFDYSDCLKNCVNDSSKIVDMRKSGRLTKPTVGIDKKGKKTEIIEVADCNCMFDFKYQIKDLPKVNRKDIKVNGQTLNEIDSKNIWSEIKIE